MVSLLFCSANYEQQPSDLLAPRNAKRHGWRCNQAASLHRERHMGIVAQRAEHLRRAHETVRHKVRIQVSSRRGATRIRARGNCPLKGPSPGLRYVKCGKGAI